MKRTFFHTMMMLVAVATLTLTSCSKEPEDLILGEWNVTSANQSATILGKTLNFDISQAFQSFEFQEDGTCLMKGHKMKLDYQDGKLGLIFGEELESTTCTYTINGNNLELVGSSIVDFPLIFNIDLLERKEMNLSLSESISKLGISIDITMNIAMEK